MNIKKRDSLPAPQPSKIHCNTKPIIVNFRVSVKEWEHLLRKSGGKGKLSRYIRKKLGLEED